LVAQCLWALGGEKLARLAKWLLVAIVGKQLAESVRETIVTRFWRL